MISSINEVKEGDKRHNNKRRNQKRSLSSFDWGLVGMIADKKLPRSSEGL